MLYITHRAVTLVEGVDICEISVVVLINLEAQVCVENIMKE